MTTGSCSADARNHVTAILLGIFDAIGERATLRGALAAAHAEGVKKKERRPACLLLFNLISLID